MLNSIINAIEVSGYEINNHVKQPAKESVSVPYIDMEISQNAKDFLASRNINTLWRHQRIAVEKALSGRNVCVSTSTSSGKTEIFQLTAIEILERNPKAKILAIYSAKALNSQQKSRWEKTGYTIGQIDGSITKEDIRLEILKKSRIVVMTPDVMHAFLLGKLHYESCNAIIRDFITHVELVIIDEIHLYKGVFGTNASYLFRRFNNLRRILRKDLSFPLYVTASATLPNPAVHSENITGAPDFVNIGGDIDGSPMSLSHILYISPVADKDNGKSLPFRNVADLSMKISEIDNTRSITFVESRQRTGEIVLAMGNNVTTALEDHEIYPYRAGIEEEARERILAYMQEGRFKGIISTSALEIGIDIDGLNVAIIANIPQDRNSFYQRIGRVGRGNCNESFVIIINDGSFKSQLLFGEYEYNIDNLLPDLEPSLYLDSKDIKYVHATCHADFDKDCCELSACGFGTVDRNTSKYFPESFYKVCVDVANHQTTRDYDRYADVQDPHFQYSLRNNSTNYCFTLPDGEELSGESVTRQQMHREAYKGAIRNITRREGDNLVTKNLEIVKIDKVAKTITVKPYRGNNIITKPDTRTFVFPNFSSDRRFKTIKCGDTRIYNLGVMEKVNITGYRKTFFGNTTSVKYDRPFSDTLRTTGVVIFNPELNKVGVERRKIAQVLFEAFLMRNAFDRNDINFRSGFLRTPCIAEGLYQNDKFIALYDINQLNVTSNLLDENRLRDTFNYLLKHYETFVSSLFVSGISEETQSALIELCNSILDNEMVNVECQSRGNLITIFKPLSEVLYKNINANEVDEDNNNDTDENDDDTVGWTPCKIISPLKGEEPDTVKYAVLLNDGTPVLNVETESLKPTERSNYTYYDWESGQIND